MSLLITLPFLTSIQNMQGQDSDDFEDGDYQKLLDAEEEDQNVKIISQATDGYWNVELEDGTVIDALSHHHLSGVEYDTEVMVDTRPQGELRKAIINGDHISDEEVKSACKFWGDLAEMLLDAGSAYEIMEQDALQIAHKFADMANARKLYISME